MKKFVCLFFIIIFCVFSSKIFAQEWTALPPYNILWPLWSPVLSPPDAVTGLPIPLITNLDRNTILPVQPALVWDPALPFFYLLYNDYSTWDDPVLKYFDLTWGVYNYYEPFLNWPPDYLLTAVDSTAGVITIPSPIPLPINYQTFFTFDPIQWVNFWVPSVNTEFQYYYGVNPYLLTASEFIPSAYTFTGLFAPPII